MVEFPDKNIYLYSEGIDFRKGIKSLSNLISVSYPNSNLTDSLFIFFSKDKKQVLNVKLFKGSLVKIFDDIYHCYIRIINLFDGQCRII